MTNSQVAAIRLLHQASLSVRLVDAPSREAEIETILDLIADLADTIEEHS